MKVDLVNLDTIMEAVRKGYLVKEGDTLRIGPQLLAPMRSIGGEWAAHTNANPASFDHGALDFGNLGPDGREGIASAPDEYGVPYLNIGYADLATGGFKDR